MTVISFIIPPDVPPEAMVPLARAAEGAGIAEIWLWEDCFAQSGLAPAAAILGATERLRVGIGLLPAPLRNVALTAMEVAALERSFPSRFLPGIGHGVQSWMGQAGVRVRSPLTLLEEYGTALRRLLAGESVTVAGRYVSLDDVQLRWPPEQAPALWYGAEGPRTMALAGRLADGILLTGTVTDEDVTQAVEVATSARRGAGVADPLEMLAFLAVPVDLPEDGIRAAIEGRVNAGATRVAVLGLAAGGGPPTRGAELTAFVDVLGRLAA